MPSISSLEILRAVRMEISFRKLERAGFPSLENPSTVFLQDNGVVIERIPIEDDDLLHVLEDLGISPGLRVEVLDPPGHEGTTSVRWGEKTAIFSSRHAERIYAVANVA